MSDHAVYGEQGRGYDHQGEPVTLLPRRPEPRLEIVRPGELTHQDKFEAERRAVVAAEDEEIAKTVDAPPPSYDLGFQLLINASGDIATLVATLERMPADARRKHQFELSWLARTLARDANRVRELIAA